MNRFTLEQRRAEIARKIAAGLRVPPIETLRRVGDGRTDSKRGLLETLDRIAAVRGRKEPLSLD